MHVAEVKAHLIGTAQLRERAHFLKRVDDGRFVRQLALKDVENALVAEVARKGLKPTARGLVKINGRRIKRNRILHAKRPHEGMQPLVGQGKAV